MNDLGLTHSGTSQHIAWWFGPFILFVITIGVMSPLIGAGFTDWDDPMAVSRNPSFNPPTVQAVKQYWVNTDQPYMQIYDPLTNSMWGLLSAIAPRHAADDDGVTMSAMPFHLASVLLHACSAVLVFFILRRLTTNELAALAGAVLFAVHPVQVEAVGWVSGAKDVLSATLGLLAIWQYIRAVQRRSWLSYVIALMAMIAAMLAKPSAVCLPGIVLALDWFFLRRRLRTIFRWLSPWFILAAPMIWLGRHAQPSPLVHSPYWLKPIIAGDAITFYFGKLIWPVQLCIDYGHSPYWLLHVSHPVLRWTIALAVPLVVIAVCALLYRRARWALGTLAVFVAALLPILGLIRFEFQLHSTTSDHYLYLAMLAPAMAVAMGFSALPTRKWIVPAVAVGVVFAGLSDRQCYTWKNNMALMEHALAVNPSSLAANNFLGFYYDQQQPPDLEKAGKYYARVLADHPNVAWVHFNVGRYLTKSGQLDAAIQQYRQAIALDPSSEDAYLNYGAALATRGRDEEAMAAFDGALRLNPTDARAFENMGVICANRGDVADARRWFTLALQYDPNRPVSMEYLRTHPGDSH